MAGKDNMKEKKLDDLNKKDLLNFAKELIKKLEDTEIELKTAQTKVNELEDIKTKNEDFNKKLLKRLKKLEQRCDETDERMYQNEIDINKLNQYSRRENIEIVGIPNNIRQENLENYVINIIKELGVECSSYDIAACHRLNSKDSDGNKNTIVRFLCRKKVNAILSNKKKLSNIDIKARFQNRNLYIMENLSPMNRKTLDSCNYLKKKKLIASCWSFNGQINIKYTNDEDEKPTKLNHFEDIFYEIDNADNFL